MKTNVNKAPRADLQKKGCVETYLKKVAEKEDSDESFVQNCGIP